MPKALVRPDGPAIFRFRTVKGLTQDEVATKSGYAKRTIERIENGGRTTLSTLSDIADALDVSVDTIVHLKYASSAHLSKWIEESLDAENDVFLRDIHLNEIVCPNNSADAVTLTCHTSIGDHTYCLRRNTTAAEFCAALRNDLFRGVEGYELLAIGTAEDQTFDAAHTVAHIAAHSKGVVSLFRYPSRGVLGLKTSSGSSFGPAEALAIAKRGCPPRSSRAVHFYIWLFERPLFKYVGISKLAGVALGTLFRFALKDLLYVGWLYAESNTEIQTAVRIARVIKLVPIRFLNGEYFDTLAWIAYRSGNLSEGLSWARKISERDYSEIEIRAYHIYFLLRGLNIEPDTQILIRDCFDLQTQDSVEKSRVLNNDDITHGSIDIDTIKLPFFHFWTGEALMISLTLAFFGAALILFPRVFLWMLGINVALVLIFAFGVIIYVNVSEKFEARSKVKKNASRKMTVGNQSLVNSNESHLDSKVDQGSSLRNTKLVLFGIVFALMLPILIASDMIKRHVFNDLWILILFFISGIVIPIYFWKRKFSNPVNSIKFSESNHSKILSGDLIEVSIDEFSEVYNLGKDTIIDLIKRKSLIGWGKNSNWLIAVNPKIYSVDKIEQPKFREKILIILKDNGIWISLVHLLFMFINLGSLGQLFWFMIKGRINSEINLILFLITLPVWLYSIFSETSGKIHQWKIHALKITHKYFKISSVLIGVLYIYWTIKILLMV